MNVNNMSEKKYTPCKELSYKFREKALRLAYEYAGAKVFKNVHEEIEEKDLDDLFALAELNLEFIKKDETKF
jgi:hypothetical protein